MNAPPSGPPQDDPTTPAVSPPDTSLAQVRFGLLARHRWAIFILPFLVYMLLGHFETAPVAGEANVASEATNGPSAAADQAKGESRAAAAVGYPLQYALRIVATIGVIWLVFPGYREFPLRVSGLAVGVGIVGVVLWVGICRLDLESKLLVPLGLGWMVQLGERVAFNPFAHLGDRPAVLVAFLAVRFLGLAVVVPLIEEFFLRGYLMRMVADPAWWKLPIGQVNTAAIVTGTVYGVLAHPAELLAAAVWFSLITWLMVRTRNIWDCVAAHAVTNFLLGIYVLTSGTWALW